MDITPIQAQGTLDSLYKRFIIYLFYLWKIRLKYAHAHLFSIFLLHKSKLVSCRCFETSINLSMKKFLDFHILADFLLQKLILRTLLCGSINLSHRMTSSLPCSPFGDCSQIIIYESSLFQKLSYQQNAHTILHYLQIDLFTHYQQHEIRRGMPHVL